MVSFTVYSFVFSTLMTTTLQFGAFPGNSADLERMKKLDEISVKIRSKIGLNDRPFVSKPARNRFTKYYAEIQEVVIRQSQIPENMTDSNVVQFKVVRDNQGRKLEVTSANLIVKIKYKRKHQRRLRRRRKLKVKKISLKLSTVDSVGHPVDVVSSITTKIRRTKWLKVPLPTKIIESAMQRTGGNLYLHLNCEGCDKATQLILMNRNRIKKWKPPWINRREPKLKRRLNRNRPFIMYIQK